MVDLKKISTQDLFQELANRKDGRAYIECVIAGLKMQEVGIKAKGKARKKIIDAIDRFLEEEKKQYLNELPNYVAAMEKDKVHFACGEDDNVCNAIRKYMEYI